MITGETTTTPAPASTTPAPARTTSAILLTDPKNPGTFCVTDEVDVEDWITDYQRISEINRSDVTLMLVNVLFYFRARAKVLLKNREAEVRP